MSTTIREMGRIDELRHRMVDIGLLVSVIIGAPAALTSVLRAFETGWRPVMIGHCVAFVLLAGSVAFKRWIGYHVRAFVLLAIGMTAGALGLFTYGLISMGIPFLMATVVVSVILYGRWGGYVALGAGTLIIAAMGAGIVTGLIPLEFDIARYAVGPLSWVTAGTAYACFMVIVVAMMGTYYGFLIDAVGALDARTGDLAAANERLEAEISERVKTEEALRATRAYLDNIINSMPSILVGISSDGSVLSMNRAAEAAAGRAERDVRGRPLVEVLPAFAGHLDGAVATLRDGKTFDLQHAEVEWDGAMHTCSLTVFPLIMNGIRGGVVRIDDTTEVVRREQRLRRLQKMDMIGTMAGGLAHDFNNILSGIMGSASILQHDLKDEDLRQRERIEDSISTIRHASRRAADTIRALMTISRKQENVFVPADLSRSIGNVVKLCESSFPPTVTIEHRDAAPHERFIGVPAQMEQVLLNVCMNAMHAMTIMRDAGEEQGGVVAIESGVMTADDSFAQAHPGAEAGSDYLYVRIADSGVGMDRMTRERAFEPFFSTKQDVSGTGLGLVMVDAIMKQHRGIVDVESEPGVGTAVTLYLPRCHDEEQATGEASALEQRTSGAAGTVLVIDDDPIVRGVTVKMLDSCGYAILTATSGEEGIMQYRDHLGRIDAVFLDMSMPGISGVDVFEELRRIDPCVRVLLSSGFTEDDRMERLVREGAAAFLPKPFTMTQLAAKLREVIGSA